MNLSTVFGVLFLFVIGIGVDSWFSNFLINWNFVQRKEEFWLLILLSVIAILLPLMLLREAQLDKSQANIPDKADVLTIQLFKWACIAVAFIASSYILHTVFLTR